MRFKVKNPPMPTNRESILMETYRGGYVKTNQN